MIDFINRIKGSWQLYALIGLTISLGAINTTLGIAAAIVGLAIVGFRGWNYELIVFFLLMLLLSDSRSDLFLSFQTSKKIGLVLLSLLVFLKARQVSLHKNVIFLMVLPFIIWSFITGALNIKNTV